MDEKMEVKGVSFTSDERAMIRTAIDFLVSQQERVVEREPDEAIKRYRVEFIKRLFVLKAKV